MPVITISRQLGSLGDEVAQAIGERLEYRVTCREIINHAAIRAGTPEVALATIDDLGLFGIKPSAKARFAYHHAVQQIMEELAQEGEYVIIGRAGQVILKDHPQAFHVKIIAPTPLRVERISQGQNISLEAAMEQVGASDRARKNYLRRYYHVRWDDPELYDMIVNTARLTPQEAACIVSQAFLQCLIS